MPLTELANEITSELPGLAPEHAARVIKSATNRFLERSCVWRVEVFPELDAKGVATLVAPKCSIIHHHRDIKWCNLVYRRTRHRTKTPYDIEFSPAPEVQDHTLPRPVTNGQFFTVGDLSVTLVLKMGPDDAKIPDYILDVHNEALRATALSRLLLEPSKPYTDPQLGAIYVKEASARTMEAKDIAERQYGRNETRWRFPRWA